jgi:ribonucleoside-diphosphate reductase alpha chain
VNTETATEERPIEQSEAAAREVSDYIFREKYRDPKDSSFKDAKLRIARAAAAAEKDPDKWTDTYQDLHNYFLPGGRAILSLGSDRPKLTSMNCFSSQKIEDSIDGIFEALHNAARTMQAGGGIGYDFSSLRPRGAAVKGVGSTSTGPISFMHTFDAMCANIASAGHRRGAQMGVLRVDHPDIEEFVTAKRGDENKALRNFNLSVAVTDDFMKAVRNNAQWNLVFEGRVYKTVSARALWDLILTQAYDYAEPGVIFIDTINRVNNGWYFEHIAQCNPCGEQPLSYLDSCNLGSVNLTRFVRDPFVSASFDFEAFSRVVATAVRFLDNVIDVGNLPLTEQRENARKKRRVGLGITGLGDALWMLGMEYSSPASVEFSRDMMRTMRDSAYRASIELAREKGAFPLFDRDKHLQGEFIQRLPGDIQDGIRNHGIRNSHLLTIAPTGTTSLLWGNVSSGVEPILALTVERKIREGNDLERKVVLEDYAYRLWKRIQGNGAAPSVKTAPDISAREHIEVMAALQEFVDASISKTINFDPNTPFEEFREAYTYAYEKGLKGCTVYRDSGKIGAVIRKKGDDYRAPMPLPEERTKYAIKTNIPNEGDYEVEVTVVEDRPREVWMHAPIEHKRAELMAAIVRLMSIGLRCNIDPKVLLKQLRESMLQYGNVSSPLGFLERSLLRVMSRIGIRQELSTGSECPVCGGALIAESGCIRCSVCSYDKCS